MEFTLNDQDEVIEILEDISTNARHIRNILFVIGMVFVGTIIFCGIFLI